MKKTLPAGLLTILFAVLYVGAMSPGVAGMGQGWWDTQEAQAAGTTWGMLHAPGYPLYAVLANVLNIVVGLVAPATKPAWRVTLLSGLCGVATLVVLYDFLRRITGRWWLSALSVALLGVSRTFWAMAARAEVYTLETLLVALTLWLARRWDESGDDRWLPWVGLALGSGVAHHRTPIVLAPALAALLLWRRKGWRSWLSLALFSALPFLVYAYLPLIGYLQRPVLWRDPTTLSGLWYIFSAAAWRGGLEMPASLGEVGQRLALTWQGQAEELGVAGAVVGGAGLLAAIVRQRRVGVLLGLPAVGMVLLGITVYFSEYRIAEYAVQLLPLSLLLAVGLGLAVSYAGDAARRWRAWLGLGTDVLAGAALLAGVVGLGLQTWPTVDQRGDYRGEDILQELACLDALSDEPLMVMTETPFGLSFSRYARYTRRLDLTWPSLWDEHPDLAGPLAAGRRLFLLKDAPGDWRIPDPIRALLGSGRYYLAPTANPDVQEVRYRFAALPPGVKMLNAAFDQGVELAAYRYGLCRRRTGTSLRVDLWWRAERPLAADHRLKAHLLAADGQRITLGDQAHPVRGAHPTSWWWANELILDETDLPLPEGVLPPGARLVVGLYRVVGDQFPAIGQQIIPLE